MSLFFRKHQFMSTVRPPYTRNDCQRNTRIFSSLPGVGSRAELLMELERREQRKENCGFRFPERKTPADFLAEVISKKDQAQYWAHYGQPYHYVSVEQFTELFKEHYLGQKLSEELSQPCSFLRSCKGALSFTKYSMSKKQLLKACTSREWLLVKRNLFVYVFKSIQLIFLAFITMTVFLRTRMRVDQVHANGYMSALFFSLFLFMTNNYPELIMTISRLPVFHRQRDSYFYPAWIFSLPLSILKIPHSFLASLLFTSLAYYVIGYSPEVERFICQFLLFFAVHLMSASLHRALGSISRTFTAATVAGSFSTFAILSLGGFILPLSTFPSWMTWGFWMSPLSYGEIGITVNEFHAPRWRKVSPGPENISVGEQIMRRRGLLFEGYFYWISLGALFGFFVLFNIVSTIALTYLGRPSRVLRYPLKRFLTRTTHRKQFLIQLFCRSLEWSKERVGRFSRSQCYFLYGSVRKLGEKGHCGMSSFIIPKRMTLFECAGKMVLASYKERMFLPFEPLVLSFNDVNYFIDAPQKMGSGHIIEKKLLCDVIGTIRPHVLTALMGVSGAGKTTLLDVLSGRKTIGRIEGDIRVGGYPKDQETFRRVSAYCEQSDLHSSYLTFEESIKHSAWLRLGSQIDHQDKMKFVNEVSGTIELNEIKDNLVGVPGTNGLSMEQRRRLTLGVELMANPSIMFIDEPTSGLDARTAAIVMRAVRNVADRGRAVVCTIHQPSTDIFESFVEMILMKKGGQIIYFGQIGQQSKNVISYFESIPGVTKIKYNDNPAAWMLEVTAISAEQQLGIDFSEVYKASSLYQCMGSVHSMLEEASPVILEKSRVQPAEDLSCLCLITVLRFTFLETWNQYVAIEVPYIIIQAVICGMITYFALGFPLSIYKLLWYIGTLFLAVLSFTYLGMLFTSVSHSLQQIPGWWVWCYWICPASWTLINALLTSQYGDVSQELEAFGEHKHVDAFLKGYFGFQHGELPLVGLVLVALPLLCASLFVICTAKVNFQKR